MNRIIFKKARFKNFLSYGNQWQEFVFPVGMNMVQGLNLDTQKSNGAGKSSVTEIIPFGLFGKTIKNLAQSKVLNWSNKKACMVELYLNVNDDEYVFKRGLKPNKFIVTRNGSEIVRPSDIKSFQFQMEEEVIGMDFKTFKNLIYFSPNNTISILGAKKEVKRQFLESLFDLTDYSDMLKLTNTKISNITTKVTDGERDRVNIDTMIEMLKNDCENMSRPDLKQYQLSVSQCQMLVEGHSQLTYDEVAISGLDGAKKHLSGLRDEQLTFTEKKSSLESKVLMLQQAIDTFDIETPKKQAEKLQKAIDLLQERIGGVDISDISDMIVVKKEQWQEYTDEIDNLNKQVVEITKQSDLCGFVITSENDNINTIKARQKNIEGHDVCDFCGSDCDHEKIDGYHTSQIEGHRDRILSEEAKKEANNVAIKNINEAISDITEKKKVLGKELEDHKQAIINADKDIEKREQCIENMRFVPDVKQLELNLAEKNVELAELQQHLRDITWKFDMNKEDIEIHTKKVDDLQVQSDEFDRHNRLLEDAKVRLKEAEKQFFEMTKLDDEIKDKVKLKEEGIVEKQNQSIIIGGEITKYNMMLDHLNYLRVSLRDDNVKQFAISSLLPYLNSRANYYLQESGFPYIVYIDGWLDVLIKGMGTEDVGYDSLSGGEQKAMDMAIQLACNDIAELHAKTTLGIAVYDEIMDTSLDADGVQKLMDVVRVKQRDTNNCVLVISHRDEVKELDFDNYVMIEKENGFSVIHSQTVMV